MSSPLVRSDENMCLGKGDGGTYKLGNLNCILNLKSNCNNELGFKNLDINQITT